MIKEIMEAVSIPVMAKGRIGHIVEYFCSILSNSCIHLVDTLSLSSELKSYKLSASITSMSQRFLHLPIRIPIWTSMLSVSAPYKRY